MRTDLGAILRKAGVAVTYVGGWDARGSEPWDPVGVMVHHTADGNGPGSALPILVNGRSGIPGPLVQLFLDRTGLFWVVSSARANHAGVGNRSVLDGVRAGRAPLGDAHSAGSMTGNRYFVGIEVDNNGVGQDYPDVQLAALFKGCAALCLAFRFSPQQVIHHREWTSRKIDASYRGDVRGAVGLTMLALAHPRATSPAAPHPEGHPTMPPIVDTLVIPKKGSWHLTADGGVLTVHGAFYGSYPGSVKGRSTFERGHITARVDGKAGYTLWDDVGRHFDFPYLPSDVPKPPKNRRR